MYGIVRNLTFPVDSTLDFVEHFADILSVLCIANAKSITN